MIDGPFRGGRSTRPLTWLLLSGLLIIACGPHLCLPVQIVSVDDSEDWDWTQEDDDYPDDDCQDNVSASDSPDPVDQNKEYQDTYFNLLRSQPAEQLVNTSNMILYNTPIKQFEQEGLSGEDMVFEIRRQWAAMNDLPETEYRALRCFWLAMFAVKFEMPEALEMVHKSMEKINQATNLESAQPSEECPEGWYMAWLKYQQTQLAT